MNLYYQIKDRTEPLIALSYKDLKLDSIPETLPCIFHALKDNLCSGSDNLYAFSDNACSVNDDLCSFSYEVCSVYDDLDSVNNDLYSFGNDLSPFNDDLGYFSEDFYPGRVLLNKTLASKTIIYIPLYYYLT